MNPPNTRDFDLETLGNFIQEHQKLLEEDKLKFQRNVEASRERRSDGNYNQPCHSVRFENEKYDSLPNNVDTKNQVKEKCAPKENTTIFMIRNPREEEINKFIDKISEPKESLYFPSNKELRKSYPQARSDFNLNYTPINIRERKIDHLSEKFASSECPLTKPSCRQLAKNLYSSITFNDFKQNNLERFNDTGQSKGNAKDDYFSESEKTTNEDEREEYLRAKYNHPRIVISHYKENNKTEEIEDLKNKMVKIGEFSPLNPNLPGGATVLGLGEWDEKRHMLLQKYRQVSRSPSPSFSENDQNQRSIATQTDLSDDWSPNITLESDRRHRAATPERSVQTVRHPDDESQERRCASPQLRVSPLPKCFEHLTEKEVKELIYRQDLEKQIEEKNRLKEKMRKKEAEEEAKIEAKIQRDLEKMRRQYEEERLLRLELAIRRREEEDLLRQRLALEQQKTAQESKVTKKPSMKGSGLPNYTQKKIDISSQSDLKKPKANVTRLPYSRSLPERSAASIMSSVHEELRQPLLQPSNDLQREDELLTPADTSRGNTSPRSHRENKSTQNKTTSPPIPVDRAKEVDILARKAVFDTSVKNSSQINNLTAFPSDTIRDRLKEVDNILKQPLLPESRVLPPVSQPLLHATIPPLSTSLRNLRGTTAVAANHRTNTDILEDKWKVPFVEQNTEVAPTTKHNARILTQLGTFRRQLQEESLRMRQRVREDSP